MNLDLNWNLERWKTRDRLLYSVTENLVQPHPQEILSYIQPQENFSRNTLMKQLYDIAKLFGFSSTDEDFFTKFGTNNGTIFKGTLNTFPMPGSESDLYFDEETNIVYRFKILDSIAIIDEAIIEKARIVENEEDRTFYTYIPIRTMPIDDLIYDGGNYDAQ